MANGCYPTASATAGLCCSTSLNNSLTVASSLTGSEIEQAFVEALYAAFDENAEPTDLTVATVLNDLVPLSKLMAEQITGLRTWAKGRARCATTAQVERRVRKLAWAVAMAGERDGSWPSGFETDPFL